ncbi:CaiB/BaiF CoA transferase family protein [Enterovibrio baiacu]|uniref:CaiB/BaiF CoA transferase family protein n=1 Tax=Enterovibrio baiacu TaxID=2491023 RepID=UPI00101142B4|nr:CaiB/BaiF CoA-transferase family protein [Enterovibrio baiacu]MBE1274511.1 CoA transferase [Enterovibrio baiacu]
MHDALSSYRVLDLTNVLAGPFACHQLAHLGAEVIKVEVPLSGDLARQLGADVELNREKMGISFLAQNSGKRSITVNLKHPDGKAVLKKLVESADVLVENFRPGVMARLGLDYEVLKTVNPKLIYCAISGYGADGPMKNLPAYDQIIQGMSGVMSITGAPDNAPYRVGYPIADTIGGITAAFAISSALAGRAHTGKGCFIDVSMLESTLATMGWAVSNFLVAGREPQPMGNDNVTASPSGAFNTGDGLINIAANKQEQFEAICDLLGRGELKADPRFSERQARLKHRTVLTEILEDAFSAESAEVWEQKLNAIGVPAGRVLSVPQALNLEQVKQRDFEGTFDDVDGVGRDVHIVRTGFLVDGKRPKVESPPPKLGEHSHDILSELGFSDEDIERLKQGGAV